MKTLLRGVLALAGALFLCVPALAVNPGCEAHDASGNCLPGHTVGAVVSDAVPLLATITSAGGTISGNVGSCTGTTTVTCGPFTPQLGLPIRLVIKGGATHSTYIGTTVNGCTSVNQLTALGSPIAYTTNVDEFVDVPATSGSIQYCVVSAVSAGAATVAVRQ